VDRHASEGGPYFPHASITSVSERQSGSAPRNVVIIGGILSLVAVLAIAGALYLRSQPPASQPTAAVATPPPATPAPAPSAPTETKVEPPPAPEPATTTAPRKAAPKKVIAEPPPALAASSPVRASLTVDTDVPGASVFIDRTFVGNTPLQLERLEPGQRTLNLSADGFTSITHSINLVPGANEVTLRFKEVRLDAQVPVVHKHGMGSCEGTLVASVDGLGYVTSNKNDAFALGFGQIETFAVDYMEKNLRVRQKGGKTWNFTDKAANADALFVFHREVDAARKKLADGYTPVK
jgi:PEGA domain